MLLTLVLEERHEPVGESLVGLVLLAGRASERGHLLGIVGAVGRGHVLDSEAGALVLGQRVEDRQGSGGGGAGTDPEIAGEIGQRGFALGRDFGVDVFHGYRFTFPTL